MCASVCASTYNICECDMYATICTLCAMWLCIWLLYVCVYACVILPLRHSWNTILINAQTLAERDELSVCLQFFDQTLEIIVQHIFQVIQQALAAPSTLVIFFTRSHFRLNLLDWGAFLISSLSCSTTLINDVFWIKTSRQHQCWAWRNQSASTNEVYAKHLLFKLPLSHKKLSHKRRVWLFHDAPHQNKREVCLYGQAI